jgi:ABC-type branched-subunit amino acid transport system ATPase component
MIIVEQSVNVALAVADHAVVIEKGRVSLDASADELRVDSSRLTASYLGANA